MIIKKDIIWAFFRKKYEDFKNPEKIFQEIMKMCEALKSKNQIYNKSSYTFAQRKISFYKVLRASIISKTIDNEYVDEFRRILQDLIRQEIIYRNNEIFCPEKLPRLMHQIVDEISQDKELQKIKFPFKDLEIRPLPDQEMSANEPFLDSIISQYKCLNNIENISEIRKKLEFIEKDLKHLL